MICYNQDQIGNLSSHWIQDNVQDGAIKNQILNKETSNKWQACLAQLLTQKKQHTSDLMDNTQGRF